jgi:hypothetical protein
MRSTLKFDQYIKSTRIHETLVRDGFVVLDFLNTAETEQVALLYAETGNQNLQTPYFSTVMSADAWHKKQVYLGLAQIMQKAIANWFIGMELRLANFLVKRPGPNSEILPHYDPTFFDPARGTALGIFCALTDLDPENGALHVLKGSQYAMPQQLVPVCDTFIFADQQNWIRDNWTPVRLKAGQAYIGLTNLIHGSSPNLSGTDRVAVGGLLTPAGQQLKVHFTLSPGILDEYDVNQDYFFCQPYGSKPQPAYGSFSGTVLNAAGTPDLSRLDCLLTTN